MMFYALKILLTGVDAQVTPKERVDSEIFYLTQIAQNNYSSKGDIVREHPRWVELCGSEFCILIQSNTLLFYLNHHSTRHSRGSQEQANT